MHAVNYGKWLDFAFFGDNNYNRVVNFVPKYHLNGKNTFIENIASRTEFPKTEVLNAFAMVPVVKCSQFLFYVYIIEPQAKLSSKCVKMNVNAFSSGNVRIRVLV